MYSNCGDMGEDNEQPGSSDNTVKGKEQTVAKQDTDIPVTSYKIDDV